MGGRIYGYSLVKGIHEAFRDVSASNTMILRNGGQQKGFLIDVHLAKEEESATSSAASNWSTMWETTTRMTRTTIRTAIQRHA